MSSDNTIPTLNKPIPEMSDTELKTAIEEVMPQMPWVRKGEHSTTNSPRPKSRKRHRTITVELEGDLHDFLVTNAENNERTIAQEVRFWLKKATGIK